MRSRARQHGVLEIDHSASPETLAVPEEQKAVFRTSTCSHCGAVVVQNPQRQRERGYCPKCDHFICEACVAVRHATGGDCKTLRQVFEEMQEKAFKGKGLAL